MIRMKNSIFRFNNAVFIASALFLAACVSARADDQVKASGGFGGGGGVGGGGGGFGVVTTTAGDNVVIESVEPSGKEDKEVAWLGLGVGEAPEVLSSQLGLNPGEGLTVNFIAPESPAEKADFHKNDVLAELDGQLLMAPVQFRKLIEMHAPGDTVNITYYRGGKKQTLAVQVGKTHWSQVSDYGGQPLPMGRSLFENKMVRLLPPKNPDSQAFGVSQPGARMSVDTTRVDREIQRSMDQARRAIEDAVRNADGDHKALDAAKRDLEAVARGGVAVDRDATVILRNKHDFYRTVVHTDESGTYILEAGAKSHLIAHDKNGKLLFEGDIDNTSEKKMPKEVWEKVAPMIEESAAPDGAKSKSEDKN